MLTVHHLYDLVSTLRKDREICKVPKKHEKLIYSFDLFIYFSYFFLSHLFI